MTYVAVGLAATSLLVTLGVALWARGRISAATLRLETATPQTYDDGELRESVAAHEASIGELIDRYNALLTAVDEGIRHVDRSERRVRQVVTRAQKRLAEDGYSDSALDAEADALREGDVEPGEQRELLPLPEEVEPIDEGAPSPIPGLTQSQFRTLTGA